MKQVLLDANFIISCVKQKIDFFEELPLMGFGIIIPDQVIAEIERLDNPLALQLLKKNKFKKIDLGKGHVDKLIIQYARTKPKLIIATLDRELKNKITNQKLVIRGKKKLEII